MFHYLTQSGWVSLSFFTVYDITKRSSFLNLQRWIEEVRRFTASNVPWILIGNKCDMESLREVERAEAVAMAELIPEVLLVLETSAKENTNVEECFTELAAELKHQQSGGVVADTEHPATLNLNSMRVPANFRPCSGCASFWVVRADPLLTIANIVTTHSYMNLLLSHIHTVIGLERENHQWA